MKQSILYFLKNLFFVVLLFININASSNTTINTVNTVEQKESTNKTLKSKLILKKPIDFAQKQIINTFLAGIIFGIVIYVLLAQAIENAYHQDKPPVEEKN